MNIQPIQCPSCDGNLKVENINQSIIYCMYCGASVHLETNHNKGYDMELGRLDARGELADRLLEKIEKIKPELIHNHELKSKTETIPGRIAELKQTLSYERTADLKDYVIKPFGKGMIVLFSVLWLSSLHTVYFRSSCINV
ncbi:MAG: hypothetical protein K6G43_01915 [Lachnospiraceae bacterium]|nr:hypothetical protein [Lachnospiraceae bacterium]